MTTNRVMNPADKQKWVEALRSDQYQQGGGVKCYLVDDGTRRFCCLGVAEHVIGGVKPSHINGAYLDDTKNYGISNTLQSALGVVNDGNTAAYIKGCFKDAGYATYPKLDVAVNNVHKASFKAIADWVEENL